MTITDYRWVQRQVSSEANHTQRALERDMIHDFSPVLPKALLFDMDGTLTQPALDFPRIKAAMGIGTRPILEALAEMNEAERKRAQQILHEFEEVAAAQSLLN